MALHERKDFAALAEMPNNQLAVYIERESVFMDESGLFDDKHPTNAKFLQKRAKTLAKKGQITDIDSQEIPFVRPTINSQLGVAVGVVDELEAEKIKIAKLEVKKREVQLEKWEGSVIPVDLVQTVAGTQVRIVGQSLKQAMEREIDLLGVKYKMGGAAVIELRKKINQAINEGLKRANEDTISRIGALIGEFQETRERGERVG